MLWYRIEDNHVSVASFTYMCTEAVGLSDHGTWDRKAVQRTFWGGTLSDTEVAQKLARARQDWEMQQLYIRRTTCFEPCPLLFDAQEPRPTVRDTSSSHHVFLLVQVSAYSLFYTRKPSRLRGPTLGASLAAHIPRYGNLASLDDWSLLTKTCRPDHLQRVLGQQRELLVPLVR